MNPEIPTQETFAQAPITPEPQSNQPVTAATPLVAKPKIPRNWKISWIVAVIINILVFVPLALVYTLAQAGNSNEGLILLLVPIIVFLGPVLFILAISVVPLVIADVVFIFVSLFYLLKREREYSKNVTISK